MIRDSHRKSGSVIASRDRYNFQITTRDDIIRNASRKRVFFLLPTHVVLWWEAQDLIL
jgi:hypothetical protein